MLSQTGEHGAKGKQSILSLYRNILANEGVLGLWAGNGANLLRVFPAKAVVFSCNDQYRGLLRKASKTSEDQALPGYLNFLAGGMAGEIFVNLFRILFQFVRKECDLYVFLSNDIRYDSNSCHLSIRSSER